MIKENVFLTLRLLIKPPLLNHFKWHWSIDEGIEHLELPSLSPAVTQEQNADLLKSIMAKEIEQALLSMHPDNDLGWMVIHHFFQNYCLIVKLEIVLAVKYFFHMVTLTNSWKENFITLLPKKLSPWNMVDYYPIISCNIVYKLSAKVLINRLKIILASLISVEHGAFMHGWLSTHKIYHVNTRSYSFLNLGPSI